MSIFGKSESRTGYSSLESNIPTLLNQHFWTNTFGPTLLDPLPRFPSVISDTHSTETMQDELLESIRRFSVSDDPLSTATAQTFVDAFAPLSSAQTAASTSSSTSTSTSTSTESKSALTKLKQARSTALLTLASRSSSADASALPGSLKDGSSRTNKIDENLAQLLTPVIRSRLADTTPHSLLSALNFFSALFSVLPAEAHDVLAADGILDLVLEAPDACNAHKRHEHHASTCIETQPFSDQSLVSLAVAELISSAANSTATRKYLAGHQALLDWLDIACVSPTSSTHTPADSKHKSNAIAILAGLADIKVHRAIASDALQGLTQSTSAQPTSHQDHIRKLQQSRSERKRKDNSLYATVQAELVSLSSQQSTRQPSSSLKELVQAEHLCAVELSCLEVLAYLTVQPVFKERVVADRTLLDILCTNFNIAPLRSSDINQPLDMHSRRFDGALQLSLATILSNVTSYPPTLTAKDKEIRRLRKFANAQNSKQDGGQADEDELLETIPKVDKRCTAVLEAKGAEALCAIAVAGPPPPTSKAATGAQAGASAWKVNPSKSVRRACGDALLALVTKQDRMMRGKAVQQGALKAILALSAPILQKLVPSSCNAPPTQPGGLFSRSTDSATADVTFEDLAPLQALAKLLISLNPSILFPSSDGLLSVASVICSLLLCQSASRLQKFEALLALTNLASLSPQVCLKIASFTLDSTISSKRGSNDDANLFSSTSVLAQACEQLLMEDHTMVRRAWIELLVNLLHVEDVYRYFVSTSSTSFSESDPETKGAADSQDRLILRLRMLLGLSEVDEWAYESRAGANGNTEASSAGSQGGGGEASLATRLASLAILAMVTESSTAVESLLTLDRLFPVLLSILVLDRSDDAERNEWERADLQPANVDSKGGSAAMEAQVQLNAIELGLRASCVLLSVLKHLKGSSNIDAKHAGGFSKETVQSTLETTLAYHVVQLKKAAEPLHVQEARKGLLEVMAECLKTVREVEDV
ncbi:uncharacterized protein UTRI_06630 [Ustilago trichophora]|uniref:UNC-45/Cro1/She4 central domain-containing protein n=1 Tax=Ustilago trichophora TaxID=86804 RepID=A0A5C3EN66_9BASI|nr:uncharacterized protein UTRI_06630 [Ustilago trichophora]